MSCRRSPEFVLSAGRTCSHHESLELSATGPRVLSLLVKPVHFDTNWARPFTKARNTRWPTRAVETTTVSAASYSNALPHRFPSWPLVSLRPRKSDRNRTVLLWRRGSLAPGSPPRRAARTRPVLLHSRLRGFNKGSSSPQTSSSSHELR